MEKPRGETEITDVLLAWGAEIDGESHRRQTEVARMKRERCREREERDRWWYRKRGIRSSDGAREELLSVRSSSDPALLSRHANSMTAG